MYVFILTLPDVTVLAPLFRITAVTELKHNYIIGQGYKHKGCCILSEIFIAAVLFGTV